MNNKENIQKKRRATAVDILIAVMLLLCLAGIGVRIAVGDGGLFSSDKKGTYLVSYTVCAERDEFTNCYSEGREFYLENGDTFGTLTGNATFTPAEMLTENSRGEAVLGYATDGTVDVSGTFLVKGTMTDSGFLLNSNTYIAANMTLTVSSADITSEIIITDIVKAP